MRIIQVLEGLFNQHKRNMVRPLSASSNAKSVIATPHSDAYPEDKRTFAIFCIGITCLLSLYFLALPILVEVTVNSPNSAYVSAPFFCFWLVAALIFVRCCEIEAGKNHWKFACVRRHITSLTLATSGLAMAATLVTWWVGVDNSSYLLESIDATLTTNHTTASLSNASVLKNPVLIALIYMVFVPVQEFIARGVLLRSLLHHLEGRWSPAIAIIISAIIYSVLHLYMGTYITAIVFIPGLVWGWLYWRTRSLIVVSISHIVCGLYAMFALKLI